MNKRIKAKQQKKNNLTRQEQILSQVAQVFTITSTTFGDGYLIGNNKASVCHFTLRETPDWFYGIWLSKDGFTVFGEHEDFIDKFKPSRTYLSFENDVDSFVKKVQAIVEEPILSMVDAMTGGNARFAYEEIDYGTSKWAKGYQVVREWHEDGTIYSRDESVTQEAFIKEHYEKHMQEKAWRKKQAEVERKLAFDFFASLPNEFEPIQAVGVEDGNRGARYKMTCIVDQNCTQEEIDALYEVINQLVYEKNGREFMQTLDHTFDLETFYDDMHLLRTYPYQFKKTS